MNLKFLFQLSPVRFGQYATWLLLCFALCLAFSTVNYVPGLRSLQPTTAISLLPSETLQSPSFYVLIRWVLIVSAIAWIFHKWTPWSCWGTAVSFIVLSSLQRENTTVPSITFNMTSMLLVIHAMWFQFYNQPIKESVARKTYWSDLLYPRWVFWLSIFYIALFHTIAGYSKISAHGFDWWGTGLSLQLWTNQFGWEESFVGQAILSNRSLAQFIQIGILCVELAAITALFSKYLRVTIGALLLVYYFVLTTTFTDFALYFNATLVAIFFLPLESWVNRRK